MLNSLQSSRGFGRMNALRIGLTEGVVDKMRRLLLLAEPGSLRAEGGQAATPPCQTRICVLQGRREQHGLSSQSGSWKGEAAFLVAHHSH